MLGYGMAESNKLEDTDSATCVLAMRQACKNILYTVGNSGYYAGEGGAAEGGNKMTTMFAAVDAAVIIAALAIEAVVILRWAKKRQGSGKAGK